MKEKKMIEALDNEEKGILESIANEEWTEVDNMTEYTVMAKKYAESTIKKDKRMNIRISERDLKNLKIRAMEEGLPYQTLVSMILHKYISGRLIERV